MESAKPQLHVSGLETLSKCGIQFENIYIRNLREAPGISLLVGKATHRVVEKNLRHKIQHKALLSFEEVKDTARDALVSEWNSGEVRLDEDELKLGLKAVKDQAIDKSVRLSGLHHKELAPVLNPTHVERKWCIELPGYPMDLAGTLDIQEGSASVRDTKTSAKTPSKTIADESLQLTAYALAVKVIDGIEISEVKLDYLIDIKEPKKETFSSKRDADHFKALLARVERAVKVIEKGAFFPARETDWWCSEKYCGFFRTCPYVRRPKQFAAA
ncbi:MAG: PD-(D/E)XK nuclease family protein [Acidobacteriota bacterium]|nr:PD-(D/E)XK nuclease family protein [Acidobacteriota bacterium]